MADIASCWGSINGINAGQYVIGINLDRCSAESLSDGTKLVHFSGIADNSYSLEAEYYIGFFSLLNAGDFHGSAYRGWGLGSF